MTLKKSSLDYHRKPSPGKIGIISKKLTKTKEQLSLAYTPGVAYPSLEIKNNPNDVWNYTFKSNTIAIVTDGSRVLGLGNIGPKAALPVMEGKSVLFKLLGDVDAFPICLNTQNVDEIVETVKRISPVFGGINLEDIVAPKCFYIEKKLIEKLDIPVFHDDQHGTAVVVLAGLINALKLIGKELTEVKIVINGAGAAGIAITKILLKKGAKNIILCDSRGAIYADRKKHMSSVKKEIAKKTNLNNEKGNLRDVIKGADVFIGVSVANCVTKSMVRNMTHNPIVFALSNPIPEIMPNKAKEAGAKVVATGRSDFPNQINNVLAFPGIFRGMLDVRAKKINDAMKIAAAEAIANIVGNKIKKDYIIPDALDFRVVPKVASAVVKAAMESKVAQKQIKDLDNYEKNVVNRIRRVKFLR